MEIRTLEKWEDGYRRLSLVALALDISDTDGIHYEVEDCYFDCGLDWMWTTIIAHDSAYEPSSVLHSYQAIYPREWEDIMDAHTMDDFAEIVNRIKSH